jgi:acyl-lipid Delta6-acetylenase / acyl-lipid (9-3)-desaturase
MTFLLSGSPLYYTWKCSSNLAILGLAWALVAYSRLLAAQLLSAILLALFWQQCGWLAHDFLHHQVGGMMMMMISWW